MKRQFHRGRGRSGFSLTEMLVVVGILAILLSVAVPSILHYQRELKLTELDDNARAVFVAAQNHLTALRSASAGELELSAAVGRGAEDVPAAAVPGLEAGTTLKYVSTDVAGAEPGWLVLPGSIEPELAEGCYLVEFEPASGSVYGVFFMERGASRIMDESAYQTIYEYSDGGNTCRVRAGRKAFSGAAGGFYVGYYGADGPLNVTRPDAQTLPQPKLKLVNAEELVLDIGTDAASWPAAIDQSKVYASVVVSDGSRAKTLVSKGSIRSGAGGTVVLDTLKTSGYDQGGVQNTAGWKVGASFAQWMKDGGSYVIVPGADITVTVSIWYQPGPGEGVVALPQSASVSANSLFAARSGSRAEVSYGRHLQNLGNAALDSTVTAAVQTRGIDFAKTGGGVYSWADTYGHDALPFVPIENPRLDSYHGGGLVIRELNAVKASGKYDNAGLFGVFSGSRLEKVVLVDAKVTGATAGTLAGEVQTTGGTTVSGCQSYITQRVATPPRVWGTTFAGGLIGRASNCSIQDGSFASTVVYGSNVGGLVGRSEGGITIENSYAASYLRGGANVGGLVGDGSGVTMESCYAAGTIAEATNKAGGLSSSTATVRRSYAAVEYGNVPAAGQVSGAVPGGSCANVYYLAQKGVNDVVAVSGVTAVSATEQMKKGQGLALGTAFAEGGKPDIMAQPYNLDINGVSRDRQLSAPYPYPTLVLSVAGQADQVEVAHYGDWLETEAEGSLLAYYEQFTGDAGQVTEYSCFQSGVERGDLDLTRTGAINADGYAFLSTKKLNEDWEGKTELTVKTVGMETKETTVQGRFLSGLDKELKKTDVEAEIAYYAYAIPTAALDVIPDTGCYDQVTVQGKEAQTQGGASAQEVEVSAWVNPLFGRAAYNGTKPAAPNPIHVRSLRQLANVGRFFGSRNYVQDLDIDAAIYCGDLAFDKNGNSLSQAGRAVNDAGHVTVAGFEVWGQNWDKSWGYATNMWSMPANYRLLFDPIGEHDSPGGTQGGYTRVTPFSGVYDGNGRTIRALSIRSYSDGGTGYAGLFYRLIGGTLTDVHLTDCDVIGVTGSSSNAAGILAGRLSSGSRAIGCTVKDCTVIAQGTKAGGHIGGLIGYADRGALTIQDCAVENCSVEGGEFARNAGGFVGYVCDLKAGGTIRGCTVKNVAVSNRFSKGKDTDSIEKIGSVGGFVGCYEGGSGVIDRCSVIGTGGFTVSGDTWNAGGFAGSVSDATIQGCGVRLEQPGKSGYAAQPVGGGRVDGGFVGILSGTGSIRSSYAAVKVDGATAGGFVGSLEGGSVSNCYAAGHTQSGKYSTGRANVTGTEKAGGFAGQWKDGTVDTCYTTCGVFGVSDQTTDVFANQEPVTPVKPVPDCYAVGTAFVNGGKRGSLTQTGVAVKMPELDKDQRTATFPYDTALTEGYPFRPVKGTDGNPMPHYGDWPYTVSRGPGFEWTPEPEEFGDPPERALVDSSADWNGNELTLTFVTKGDGANLANVFAPSGGHFAITTDLGYVMVFKAEGPNADGSMTVYGPGGEKLCDIVPSEQGYGEDRLRTYEFTVPTASLPPYLETINLGGYKEGYILEDVKNRDPGAPDYKPEKPFLPGDEVQVDGDFSDWNGYVHQLLTHTSGDALTAGKIEGAAFGDGNVIYFHINNQYKKNLVEPGYSGNLTGVPVTNFSISVKGYDGWDSHDFQWWRFTNLSYTGPGIYKLVAERWSYETGSESVLEAECYLTIGEDGSQEIEMALYLDEMVGKKNADQITEVKVTYGTIGGSLTIWRDPPETEG